MFQQRKMCHSVNSFPLPSLVQTYICTCSLIYAPSTLSISLPLSFPSAFLPLISPPFCHLNIPSPGPGLGSTSPAIIRSNCVTNTIKTPSLRAVPSLSEHKRSCAHVMVLFFPHFQSVSGAVQERQLQNSGAQHRRKRDLVI